MGANVLPLRAQRMMVKRFYETFDFEKIITRPPKLIQMFLDGEIEFLEQYLEGGKSILEVGCGYGRLLNVLKRKADRVVGIDFSLSLLEKAKKKLGNNNAAKLLLMPAEKMRFDSDSFDYVVCLDATFGNMPGLELSVLKEMKRVCKSGGQVIVSVFSHNAKRVQFENYKRVGLTGIWDDGIAVHTAEGFYSRRFTKKQLRNLFSQVGLSPKIGKLCPVNYIVIASKRLSI